MRRKHIGTGDIIGGMGVLTVLFVLALLASRPLIYWLVIILVATAFVCSYKDKRDRANEQVKTGRFRAGLRRETMLALLGTLEETGWCVTLGLVGVIVCNLALTIFKAEEQFSVGEAVFNTENFLVSVREYLETKFEPHLVALIAILLALWTVNKLRPRLNAVHHWDAFHTAIHRIVIVLTTLSAFTYFTAKGISNQESKWVSEMKPTLTFDLDYIGEHRRRIMAEAVVEHLVRSLPQAKKIQLSELFRQAADQSHYKDIIAIEAAAVAKSDVHMEEVIGDISSTVESPADQVLDKANKWTRGVDSNLSFIEVRTLHDELESVIATELDGRNEVSRIFMQDILGGVLGDTFTDKMSVMVTEFVEILKDSISEGISKTLFPGPRDLKLARDMLRDSKAASELAGIEKHNQVWNLGLIKINSGVAIEAIIKRGERFSVERPDLIPKTKAEAEEEYWRQRDYTANKWLENWKKEHSYETEEKGEE